MQTLTQPQQSADSRTTTESSQGDLTWILYTSAVFKLVLAALFTNFVLVDDAYIHLRYARNLVEHGEFVYNLGQPVFGLTSPLYGLLTAVVFAVSGPFVEQAVIALNVALWTACGFALLRSLALATRLPILLVFLLWPSFVDNQMLGMETPLFVLLLVTSMRAGVEGRIPRSAAAYGLALITRPEAALLAPCLAWAWTRGRGLAGALREISRPKALLSLIGPGIAWSAWALHAYGSVIPQSMLAKTGWNSEHYDLLFSLQSSLLALPRLTFLPFVDYFPAGASAALTAATLGLVATVGMANLRRGSTSSRLWFAFYLVYIAFYVVGKGATEASWYSVPSSVALLMASEPLLERWLPRRPQVVCAALAVVLLLLGTAVVFKRGGLLQFYVNSYGNSARALDEVGGPRASVLIGEIGVYGFTSRHDIIDVGALVSPEVLPLKNARHSFCRIARETEADYFVISERALETNDYPSVGSVCADDADRAWLARCELLFESEKKRTYATPE